MLCEGVMLFIWLNFVLYQGMFKTRKFFMLLGWGKYLFAAHQKVECSLYCSGLPVPIIIISAAVSHEQYGTDEM